MKHKRIFLMVGAGTLLVVAFIFVLLSPLRRRGPSLALEQERIFASIGMTEEDQKKERPFEGPPVSPLLIDQAFAVREIWSVDPNARVFILPHHVVAARYMASLVGSVSQPPSVVYIVGPDHFFQGKTVFTATERRFLVDDSVMGNSWEHTEEDVSTLSSLRFDDRPFLQEHSISALLPFIKKAWPKAVVAPMIVRLDANEEDREALANLLAHRLKENPNAIVIGSIDFSHYLPPFSADFHDRLAEDVILSLSDQDADEVEIDSSGSLSVVLKVARKLDLGRATIHAHTNSLKLLQSKIVQDSTSHFIVSFAPGAPPAPALTSMLFVGDIMLDRNVAARIKVSGTSTYPFLKIQGAEGRWFHGQDFVVGNLEGPLTAKRRAPEKSIDFAFDPSFAAVLKSIGFDVLSQANNHALDQGREGLAESRAILSEIGLGNFGDQVSEDIRLSTDLIKRRGKGVAFIGFNTTDNPLDRGEAKASIEIVQKNADHVVVFMHWGSEYRAKPNAKEIELAHWLIDQGVDAVIGSHPHWMQSVEVYKGKPIAYSLGNFVFDQDWSVETNLGLAVGLTLTDKGGELHLFPIQIENSQPRLLTGKEREKRLDRLAEISDPSLQEQIRKGILILIR